jgi:hypothetical protein
MMYMIDDGDILEGRMCDAASRGESDGCSWQRIFRRIGYVTAGADAEGTINRCITFNLHRIGIEAIGDFMYRTYLRH